MTKLASISELGSMIRFTGEIDELGQSFDLALETATSNLEKDIMVGSFTRETRFDLYLVIQRRTPQGIFEYHLALSRGFIDSSEIFTVRVANEIEDFGTDDVEITDKAIVDYELGTISFIGGAIIGARRLSSTFPIQGNYIRVDYTSGFNEDDNEGLFNTDEVPSWLKNSASINAITVIDSIDPKLRAEGDSTIDPKILQGVYSSTIEGHIRYLPKYQQPVAKS